MQTTFTVAKLWFDRFGHPCKELALDLLPMTESEAYTMRSKQTNPHDWIVKETLVKNPDTTL